LKELLSIKQSEPEELKNSQPIYTAKLRKLDLKTPKSMGEQPFNKEYGSWTKQPFQ
jgi:hypothetical protein